MKPRTTRNAGGRPYSDPYLAGVGLGLVLLAAFWIAGRGLGASGAFASAAAGIVEAASPGRAAASPYLARFLGSDGPWHDWLIVEIAGVFVGGLLSAWSAGRLRWQIERGPHTGRTARLAIAFGGGAVMGVGAVLARGCTSGQALTIHDLLGLSRSTVIFVIVGIALAAFGIIGRIERGARVAPHRWLAAGALAAAMLAAAIGAPARPQPHDPAERPFRGC